MRQQSGTLELDVIQGGAARLSASQSEVLTALGAAVRRLDDPQAMRLLQLLGELSGDGYLGRVRSHEIPVVKILAEVINGWDPDGVYEFARAWTSTLVARQDGFCWDTCTDEQRREHHRRVSAEMARRGVPG